MEEENKEEVKKEKKGFWSGIFGIIGTIISGAEIHYDPEKKDWSVSYNKKF